MSKVSTRPQVGATTQSQASNISLAPTRRQVIEFDSTAIDIVTARISEIQALASCAICLSAVQADPKGHFTGYELTDDALPVLADVIRRMAVEAGEAGDVLWEQYSEARKVANGELQS